MVCDTVFENWFPSLCPFLYLTFPRQSFIVCVVLLKDFKMTEQDIGPKVEHFTKKIVVSKPTMEELVEANKPYFC